MLIECECEAPDCGLQMELTEVEYDLLVRFGEVRHVACRTPLMGESVVFLLKPSAQARVVLGPGGDAAYQRERATAHCSRPPTYSALHTAAWDAHHGPEDGACLARWYITGPWHVAWHWWLVSVITLADLPGFPPAYRTQPGNTHEISVLALDPEFTPDPDQPEVPPALQPADLVFQTTGITDEQAVQMGTWLINAYVRGRLSPDRDFARATWNALTDLSQAFRDHNEVPDGKA